MTWDIMVWEISKWQTKQTNKPSLIDIYLYDHEVVTQMFQKTI
jgi:hypothetical protein